MSLLEHAIKNYQEKLILLEGEATPSVEQVLDLLTARDVVFALVRSRTRKFSNPAIIAKLDRRLKRQSALIAQTAPLDELRNSFHPSSEAWWWYFKTPTQRYWWDRFDNYWNALSIILLVVSIYILFDISTKLLSGEPDPVSSLVTTLQTALSTVAIGVILTREGRQKIDQFLNQFDVPIHFQQEGKLLLTLTLLILLLVFNSTLPKISKIYNDLGLTAYMKGQLLTAQALYKRAIKFNPDNSDPHYNLGLIYEDFDELDNASAEYKLAGLGNHLEGLNNLGRLYILLGNEGEAVQTLLRGLDLVTQNNSSTSPNLRYSLSKNLGWSRLKQGRYQEAQILLEEAIHVLESELLNQPATAHAAPVNQPSIRNAASAYCLLAQVLERQDNSKTALTQWENCLRYANPKVPEEDTWLAQARERLSPLLP